MKYEVLWEPSYSCLHFVLDNWEQITVEPGSMLAMDPSAEIEWKMNWWLLSALGRVFLTGESFFVSTIQANKDKSDIYLAPRFVWDIAPLDVAFWKEWIVQWWWFLASTPNVEISTKFEWMKWFLSWEWLFMIKVSWEWKFWVSSFWAILEYVLDWTESFIVDNSHIVAFESSLDYQMRQAWNGIFSAIKNWEGLVCEFTWEWKIYFQTRNMGSFAESLNPFLSKKESSWGNSGLFWKITWW